MMVEGAGSKPGSVREPSFILDKGCPLPPATYPRTSAGPASSVLLFGLAPDGVCRACRVAAATGGLLPHRFTLTLHPLERKYWLNQWSICLTDSMSVKQFPKNPFKWVQGGLFSVALSRDRSLWALPSVLPCGARTFLCPGRSSLSGQRRLFRLPDKIQPYCGWISNDRVCFQFVLSRCSEL